MEKVLMIFIVINMICFSFAMMTGGWRDRDDLNSSEMQKYAKLATDNITAAMNSPYHLKLMNITRVQVQVVSGYNYKLDFTIGPTECKKSKNLSREQIEECPLQVCDNPLECSATVWVQAWKDNPIQITKTDCKDAETFC